MTTTRRTFLGGIAAVSIPPAATVVAAAEPETPPVDHFLAVATPAERARYHADALKEAMAEIHPDRSWRSVIDDKHQFVLTIGDPRPDA